MQFRGCFYLNRLSSTWQSSSCLCFKWFSSPTDFFFNMQCCSRCKLYHFQVASLNFRTCNIMFMIYDRGFRKYIFEQNVLRCAAQKIYLTIFSYGNNKINFENQFWFIGKYSFFYHGSLCRFFLILMLMFFII